jgi:putative transposase
MRRRHSQLNFAGSTHFVTTVANERGRWFVTDAICGGMLRVLEHHRVKYQVDCFGYVLMPDHLHALFRQNQEGDFISRLMRGFKEYTSRHLFPEFGIPVAWRPNYDDVQVPGRDAALTRLTYMLGNPVRAGIVKCAGDYRWAFPQGDGDDGGSIVTISPI